MRKKSRAWILIVIIFLFMIFNGAAMFSGKTNISVYHEGKKLMEKEYKIKTSTLMSVIFRNRADFYRFYKTNKKISHVRDFSCINEEIQKDINNVIKQVEFESV